MKNNEYIIQLIIDTENDDPKVISEILGVVPEKVLKKGTQYLSPISKKPIDGKFYENNLWIYSLKRNDGKEGLYLNDVINDLLENFNQTSEELKELLKKYPTNRLNCIAYFNESNPFFQIDTKLNAKLNYYSLKLTFDFYFTGEQ
jgi:hypothetical protein